MSDLNSFEDFDRALSSAREELERMFAAAPEDGAIASVRSQLDALHGWTRGGRQPSQDEKDRLNFGHIASRELSDYDVADSLYALASYITWWGEKRPY